MASSKYSFKAFAIATALAMAAMAVVVAHKNPAHNADAGGSAHAQDRIIQNDASFALVPDQAGAVGSIQIVFRGLEQPRHLRMDVTIPDLDPFYAYPYTIDMSSAKNGFIMAGQRFRLVSASRSRIWLKWMGPSLG